MNVVISGDQSPDSEELVVWQWESLSNPSVWRQIAVGMWERPSEPALYCTVRVRVDRMLEYIDDLEAASGERITPTAFFINALGEFFGRHPDLNVVVVGNQVRRRPNVDIFCQVALPGDEGAKADLSGFKVPSCDERDLVEVARYVRERTEAVRDADDDAMGDTRELLDRIPGAAMPYVVRLMEALSFLVPVDLEEYGISSDPFGTAMVSSIGTLDLENAFAPLVPASRTPVVMLPGAIRERPVVEDGEVVVRKTLELCCTADHRCFDGYQGSIFADEMREMIEHPRRHFVDPTEFDRARAAE